MGSASGVREVRTGGRAVVDVLAAAFAEDPWLRWTLPAPTAARTLMSLFLRTVAPLEGGVVLVAGQPVQGAAVLLAPGVEPPTTPEVGELVLALHGPRARAAVDADAVLERHRPAQPVWVLHTLGVAPSRQGRGIGSALVEACLDRTAGSSLTLETASAAAREWYVRRGFVVTDEVALGTGHGLPPDAPTVWMLRHDG